MLVTDNPCCRTVRCGLTSLVGSLLFLITLFLAGAVSAGEEGDPTVSGIHWEGVDAIGEAELGKGILSTAPSWKFWKPRPRFDEQTLVEDLDRIAEFYREKGFYEAAATYELEWNADRSEVDVRIKVTEGEPIRLDRWHLEIPPSVVLSEAQRQGLLQGIPTEEGSVFGAEVYRATRKRLMGGIADFGYPAAGLKGGAEIDLEARSADVHWTLLAGPLVRFGPVRIEGLSCLDEEVLHELLTFEEGQVFSRKALGASERRIYNLGLFSSVAIRAKAPEQKGAVAAATAPPDRGEAVWPVEVRVKESKPRSFRVGIGYGSDEEFRAQASWEHRNFFGGARRFQIRGKYSSLVSGFDGEFVQPRLGGFPVHLELLASVFEEDLPGYKANRFTTALLLRHGIGGPWTLRGGPAFEWGRVREFKALHPEGEEGPDISWLSSLLVGLSRRTVDDRVAPRRGSWVDMRVEPYLGVFGSNVDYLRFVGEARGFVPFKQVVLALRVKAGTIEPVGGSRRGDIPVFKRFYSGGSNSVRGFSYQRVGPVDQFGKPQGGFTIAEGSSEIRFPVWRQLQGLVFVDAGQVHPLPSQLSLNDFLYSTGAGLRLRTRVGLVGGDVGFPLNPPEGVDRFRLHFSVGHTF
jgi:outer membrane protein insertion porin family/translocation and assembly module TamA